MMWSVLFVILLGEALWAQGWEPSVVVSLPSELMEVSALAEAGEGRVSCIQDEKGEIFIVDPDRGVIEERIAFGPLGDYEGLTRTDSGEYWVLRSDGVLLELQRRGEGLVVKTEYALQGARHKDLEGLTYDPKGNRLLLAAKDKDSEDKDIRHVFAFDLREKKFKEQPFLELSLNGVKDQVRTLGLDIPHRVNKKGRVKDALKLRFSSLAIRPGSGELVLLSSSEPCLLTLHSDGRVKDLQILDSATLPKPEGMLFLSRDKLLIASEGKKIGIGILQTFDWNDQYVRTPENASASGPEVVERSIDSEVADSLLDRKGVFGVILLMVGLVAGGAFVWGTRKRKP